MNFDHGLSRIVHDLDFGRGQIFTHNILGGSVFMLPNYMEANIFHWKKYYLNFFQPGLVCLFKILIILLNFIGIILILKNILILIILKFMLYLCLPWYLIRMLFQIHYSMV